MDRAHLDQIGGSNGLIGQVSGLTYLIAIYRGVRPNLGGGRVEYRANTVRQRTWMSVSRHWIDEHYRLVIELPVATGRLAGQ